MLPSFEMPSRTPLIPSLLLRVCRRRARRLRSRPDRGGPPGARGTRGRHVLFFPPVQCNHCATEWAASVKMCGCQVLAGDTTFVSGLAAAGFGRVCSSQRDGGARRINTDGYFLAVEGRRSNSTVHPDGFSTSSLSSAGAAQRDGRERRGGRRRGGRRRRRRRARRCVRARDARARVDSAGMYRYIPLNTDRYMPAGASSSRVDSAGACVVVARRVRRRPPPRVPRERRLRACHHVSPRPPRVRCS